MTDVDDLLRKNQDPRVTSALKAADPNLDIDARLRAAQQAAEGGVHMPDPTKMDQATRRAALAKSVGEEHLGEAGLKDIGVRFDLGFSDTFEEKKAKFMDKFPEGQFELVFDQPRTSEEQRATTILFRRHPNEPFAELDASMLEQSELLADFADMSGEIPATVLEAIFTRGGRLWTQLWKASLATASGDAFKEAAEGFRGYQKETIGELASREAQRVALGAGGIYATTVISGPINALRGAPTIAVKPGTRSAQRAAKRLGVPNLLPGQVARSPLMQKMQGQAGAVLKTVNDYVSNQRRALSGAISRLREGDLKKVLAGDLESVHDAARDQIIRGATLTPNRSLTEAGTSIQQGIAEYDDLARFLTDRAYTRARALGEPEFDLSPAVSVAQKLKEGVVGVGKEGGVKLTRLDRELEGVIDDILDLDPSAIGVDQLRALRERLWDLKTVNPGEIARKPQADAGKLYGVLTNILRNPKNADSEFVNAWRKADAMASSRFKTMEQLMVIDAAKQAERPAELAASLAQPNKVDDLRVLRNSMPDAKWREFQEGVRTHFIAPENIDTLTKRLNTFDQATLDALLTKSDQTALREVGEQIDNLNRTEIKQVIEQQETAAGMVRKLVLENDKKNITTLLSLTENRPALRRAIRAGMMEDLWNNAIKTVDGVQTVDKEAMDAALKRLRETGALKFLSFEDIRTLKSGQVLSELLATKADSGTSLQAGEATAGFRSAVRGAPGDAIHTIIEHIGVGNVLTSGWFQRIALGKGAQKMDFNNLRVLGSVLGREYEKLNRDAEEMKK